MFEDNPFYNENITEETNETTTSENTDITTSDENIATDEVKETIVQTPDIEKVEKKSTGVSTYTEIPDITKENISCDSNLINMADKFNLWLVLITIILLLVNAKKKRFANIAEKFTNFISKHSIMISFVALVLITTIFSYPKFFRTGISGKLDIITMLEFSIFTLINSAFITTTAITKAREKNILFKNKTYNFSGISFLIKSLISFSFTGWLFFLFTESQIALGLFYFFIMLTTLIFVLHQNHETLDEYKKLKYIIVALQISLIGTLTEVYIVLLIGAILTGLYFPDAKDTIKFLRNKGK